MKHMKSILAATAAAAALLIAAPADAAKVSVSARLSGKAEVPPNTSRGTGTMSGTYDTVSKVLTYRVTYRGLSGAATAAHFHGPASANQNTGVAVGFANAASPIRGTATLNDAQANELLSGLWYVNVHTAANPGGEIRGQVRAHVATATRAQRNAREVPITQRLNTLQLPR